MTASRIGLASLALVAALAATACDSGGDEATPSASASALPTAASASPSPTAEAFDLVSGADVAILAKLESPTTGETWHEPVPTENLGLLGYPDLGIEDTYLYYEVGTHGSATIVVAVAELFEFYIPGQTVQAMFEVDAAGARLITCPSARPIDPCIDWSTDWEAPGRSIDTTTHYDSLTYPLEVQPAAGWYLQPSALGTSTWPSAAQAFGDATTFPGTGATIDNFASLGRDERIVLAELGQSTLVEFHSEGAVPGTTAVRYGVETPYSAVIQSASQFTSGTYGQGVVTWDDAADTFTEADPWSGDLMAYPVRTAGLACFGPDETIAAAFDPDEWIKAGSHVLGFDVYLPATGGNDLAAAAYETMRDASWGGEYDGVSLDYPYTSYEEFLDDRSIFAWQRGDGAWVIALDGYATNRVYECA